MFRLGMELSTYPVLSGTREARIPCLTDVVHLSPEPKYLSVERHVYYYDVSYKNGKLCLADIIFDISLSYSHITVTR